MRCTACGVELILTNVVQDGVPGVEHHTFICSDCHVTERRVVLTRHGREDDTEPMPVYAAPPTVPASKAQEERIAPPGILSRVVAKIRGY
jgi:hypothetical protein